MVPKIKPITQKKQIDTLWNSLVKSAFDFFERAVDEHKTSPKYAILHLATSVELFLKARLMAEHWTLIISPKMTPTFDQLKSGDFQSVTPSEAIKRLNGVLPAERHVTKDAQTEFESLALERNKIAHFFHDDLDKESRLKNIVQRQCRVWFHVHRLLTLVWHAEFRRFSARLNKLDATMRGQRKFLETIFKNVANELKKHRDEGYPVTQCPACRLEALKVQDLEEFTWGHCIVCQYQNNLLKVTCPDCSQKEVFLEHGYDKCPCGHKFTPEELGDLLDGASRPTDDTGHGWMSIYCCECETDTVYEFDGQYVCLNCMQEWDEISVCDWCSECSTGDTGGSYLYGCGACEGNLGFMGESD